MTSLFTSEQKKWAGTQDEEGRPRTTTCKGRIAWSKGSGSEEEEGLQPDLRGGLPLLSPDTYNMGETKKKTINQPMKVKPRDEQRLTNVQCGETV